MLSRIVHSEGKLYKFQGILWQPFMNEHGESWMPNSSPLCPNAGCLSELAQEKGVYFCHFCQKEFPCPDGYQKTKENAEKKYLGYLLKDATIYSLDLHPTKVVDEDEDDNYWVQARISEKGGKRMAIVYFGEKIHGEQNKKDYSQIFIDFNEEQLRFDKSNKNPMRLLAKLTAEFPSSLTSVVRRKISKEK